MNARKPSLSAIARLGLARLGITAISSAVGACAASAAPSSGPLSAASRGSGVTQLHSTRETRATWVWTSETVLVLEQRRALLAFAQAHRVNALYLQYSPKYEETAGFSEVAEFLRQARTLGIDVTLVAGDPRWALTLHHATALALIDNTGRLNRRLAEAGAPKVRAVQYDVEPYLLAEWKTQPMTVEPQYANLLVKLHEAAKREGLELWLTLPFWFEHHRFGSTTLDRLALDVADGIVVMAYRDTLTRVVRAAQALLEHANAVGRPVVVAIETSCRQPPEITFCSASQRELESALTAIQANLSRFRVFSGIAVHQYAYWRELLPDRGSAPDAPRQVVP